MICKNCGFQNAPGDEFCGSCGQFLEWTGEAATRMAAADSPTIGTPGPGQAGATGTGSPTEATGAAGATAAGGASWADPTAQTTVSSTTAPRGSASGSRAAGATQQFGQPDIICWNCSRRNPPSRSFCQQCGERLVAGKATAPMTTGVAAGAVVPRAAASQAGGRRLLPVAVGVVVVLLLLGGAVVFGPGFLSSPVPTPTPIFVVSIPPTSSAIAGSLVPSTSPGSSVTPIPGSSSLAPSGEPTPTSSEPPTSPPTAPPTAGPTPTATAAGRFRCNPKSIKDRSPTRWLVTQVSWKPFGGADRFTVTIERTPTRAPNMATVTVQLVPVDEVQSKFGVPGPTSGDIALVIKMPPPIRFSGVIEKEPNMQALKTLRVSGKGSGNVFAVLGVAGDGCFDFQIPLWAQFADPPSPSEIIVDIRRP